MRAVRARAQLGWGCLYVCMWFAAVALPHLHATAADPLREAGKRWVRQHTYRRVIDHVTAMEQQQALVQAAAAESTAQASSASEEAAARAERERHAQVQTSAAASHSVHEPVHEPHPSSKQRGQDSRTQEHVPPAGANTGLPRSGSENAPTGAATPKHFEPASGVCVRESICSNAVLWSSSCAVVQRVGVVALTTACREYIKPCPIVAYVCRLRACVLVQHTPC